MSISMIDKISIKFIEKYYEALRSKHRDQLISFYQPHSKATWGDENGGQNSKTTATGKDEINQLFDKFSFEEEVEISIRTFDTQTTPENGILLSVIGLVTMLHSNTERKFSQTFYLLPFPGTDQKRYYVCNDLFRYHSEFTNNTSHHPTTQNQTVEVETPQHSIDQPASPTPQNEETETQPIQNQTETTEIEKVDTPLAQEKEDEETKPKGEFKKPEKFPKRYPQNSNYSGKQKQYVPKNSSVPQYKQVNKTKKFAPKGSQTNPTPENPPAQPPQQNPPTQPQNQAPPIQQQPQHHVPPSQPQPVQPANLTYAQILAKSSSSHPNPPTEQIVGHDQHPTEKQTVFGGHNSARGRGRNGT